jgi:hypothetical protein
MPPGVGVDRLSEICLESHWHLKSMFRIDINVADISCSESESCQLFCVLSTGGGEEAVFFNTPL